jgi:hypothetical protein
MTEGQSRTAGGQVSLFLEENTHHGAEIGCLRDLYFYGVL